MSTRARLRSSSLLLLVMVAAASFEGCARTIDGPRVPALAVRSAQSPDDLTAAGSCEGVVQHLTEVIVHRANAWVDGQRAVAKAECSGKPLSPDDCLNLGGNFGYEICGDPLNAGGLGPGDATIRIRPGPVGSSGPAGPARSGGRDGAEQVSSTNLQVAGVDEPDIVKNDARYVYVARRGEVAVIEAWPPASARLVAAIPVAGRVLRMILADARLVVFSAVEPAERMKITVFDVADPTKARPLRELVASGSFVGARRVGGAVHAVVSEPLVIDDQIRFVVTPQICREDFDDYFEGIRRDMVGRIRDRRVEDMLPTLEDASLAGGQRTTTGRMRGCNVYDDARSVPDRATSIISFDLAGGRASMITTFTDASHLHASPHHLFVARAVRPKAGDERPALAGVAAVTTIDRFALRGAEARYAGSTVVPGEVPDSFALDEHEGRLRVATNVTRAGRRSVGLTVLGERAGALAIEGSIDGVAPGEDLRGVRFVGRRAYVVTFRRIDPLFVLDVGGREPRVLGELKIPGFSTYLHPLDDRHLLTLGLDTEEVNGGVRTGGVRLQIVEVTDPSHPTVRHLEILPEGGSNALHDHHAFTFLPAPRGLLVLPIGASAGEPTALAVYGVDVTSGFHAFGKPAPAVRPVLRSIVMEDHVLAVAEDAVEAWRLPDLHASVARVRLGP